MVEWLMLVDWRSLGLLLVALGICSLPVLCRADAFSVGFSAGLAVLAGLLAFLLADPFAICFALGPVAIYLLVLGTLNLARRPFLISGARDTAALGLAVAGLVMIGPMQLFFPVVASIRFEQMSMGPMVWMLLIALYALVVVLLLLTFRPRLVIYNISIDELRPVLASVVGELDRDARWAGDSLAMPNLGVQLHLESMPAMRNVSLVSSGPVQSQQGWRRLETALGAALAQVEVLRNVRAMGLVSAALLLAFFLTLAVSRDPQAVAQSLFRMLQM